ncbi:hypothetical protein VUJ46_11780 [Chryseobacterium sp. MYb264]|uniref:hypothetical protein n=1 Tax=Chryseobacterium sp. MYb264 TaxID=2745153 RepID=UPI002E0F9D30|nr:hypothetical protein VUJ46_11780 [Chryseobacterium sp. MYb264]
MKSTSSHTFKNKLTVFFILGLLTIIAIILFAIVAFNSVSAADGLAGLYALYGIPPVILLLIIDRICVWKFGAKKVNRIQWRIIGICFVLMILNYIRLQLQQF